MKARELTSWFLVVILALMLTLRITTTQTIQIPAKTGQFERTELKPISTFTIEAPQEDAKQLYPISKIKLDKVEINRYEEAYEDETQKITVETESQGIITSQKVKYEIFPQIVEVKVKQPSIHLYGGIEAQITPFKEVSPTLYITTPKVLYKAGYSIQSQSFSFGLAYKLF